ncbi:BolA family protein [Sulfuriferula thiophila]|uniref:BolA family protein n=1 Tax=Sulfuriferula thiophila TaxID=1781211 RepID=UPI000F60F161|nr:BolA family protein [Sulfuriferula thiophila]
MTTVELMQEKLAILQPSLLEIEDESALHAGHAGAKSGGGHYRLRIVSQAFAQQNTLARHRLVYATLGNLMQNKIHALSITAYSTEEIL